MTWSKTLFFLRLIVWIRQMINKPEETANLIGTR